MVENDDDLLTGEHRSGWVRLRTLILVRWIAIAGQLATILAAATLFGLKFEEGGFALVIGASIILNIVTTFIYPENKRLSERGATLMLLFDIAQLSGMLFLSGGLNNPFSLLILAPVSIASSALRPVSAVLIGVLTIIFVSFIALYNVPLQTVSGDVLMMPRIFLFGAWAAIVIGVVFLGVFSWKVTSEIHGMSDALLATQMALFREQKLTDLGGVVAAAAHELGTPLATIKLVSRELADELSDKDELRDDALLINEQADRCRDILHSMGQAGKDDLHMRLAPLQTVIEEAAAPHMSRGKTVLLDLIGSEDGSGQPFVYRQPEIIHGLRNLVQNAVDFSETTVWIDVTWSHDNITLRIIDDGTGFPASVIGRIGDPFMRAHRADRDMTKRPGYQGMGLGLFIAKTLLERTGAEIAFANGSDRHDLHLHAGRRSGAIVELSWKRSQISVPEGEENRALGENVPFTL
ncbi:sensor histidine kinase RegB [Celeribacter litoreus]|uniref:sensor histidine kinase RegB n=1 Tax=Celeribacter litoreus TaxID=2876714 RepID=UPI001CC9BC63|nr:ActS/PrrB/RegB family redox-sensitive histidine kinase [Celeribacter litoreus]MCA0042165.1 ActS/PrrB/RegB family redox-sensitive histidine kinase [Celeribacter litoreus]